MDTASSETFSQLDSHALCRGLHVESMQSSYSERALPLLPKEDSPALVQRSMQEEYCCEHRS